MALTFNGTTQYGRVANNTNFNVTPSVTIMGWVRTTMTSTAMQSAMQRIASRYLSGATANEQYGIDIYMGMPRFLVGTTSTVSAVQGTSMVSTGVWTHVCGTYDGSTMLIYQDGQLVGSLARSGTITSSTGVFSFGADYNGSAASEYLQGSLEDIRIYNRALSQGEVETIVTCRGTGLIRNGLILNLQLDEQRSGATLAASATIYDTGPMKMNATNIVASATFSDGFLRKRRFA
ncbi:MAG: LamG domain-containing protein [Verrucomicrobiaceae bacterium]|nr:MAG: LamG domain-containing protein [Verrucomicrobiaceae bacterium]